MAHEVNIGSISNGNASVSLDYAVDVVGNVWSMAYAAGNGFILERYGDSIPPPEPVEPLEPVATVFDQTQASGNLPAIIDNAGATRGAGFNGSHVYVASRQNGDHVYYWDVNNTGAAPAELDLSGVGGGTFTLADLTVVGDHVFVSNMVFLGDVFKVYHWAGNSAAPTVLLEYPNAPARLGDAITVLGDPAVEAQLVVSGHGTKNFYIWKIENGAIPNTEPTVMTFDQVDNVNFGRITALPNGEGFIASAPNFGMFLLDENMAVVDQVPLDFFLSWPMYVQVFEFDGRRFLSYVHVKSNPAENELQILDITEGATVAEAIQQLKTFNVSDRIAHLVNIGNVSNGNASVSLDFALDSGGNTWCMAFSAGNGFILQKFGDNPVNADWTSLDASVKVFPNPARDLVSLSSEFTIRKVSVFDMTGRLVYFAENENATMMSIPVGSWSQGVHFMTVLTDGGLVGKKLVKID
jgi:hypothetical protein